MTEKRFHLCTVVYEGEVRTVRDNSLIGEKSLSSQEVVDLLNSFNEQHQLMKEVLQEKIDENEQLKSELSEKDIQLDFLKDENQHMRNLVNEKERLVKMLDNVANYMQREHREMPLDDFVEWWNNIATEGLE